MAQPVATATTVQSLEVALQSNLQLQAEVARRLQNLARRKAENRRLASRIQAQMVDTWDEIDVVRTPPPPVEPKVRAKKRTQNNQVVGRTGDVKKYTAKWNHDPFRKWTRRFFVDPDGSVPAPNEDMIKRRRLEEGNFFYHTCPPWSNKEIETLLTIATEILAKKKDNDNADSSCLDFAQVARTLEELTKSVDRLKCPTARPRSADDCRLKYAEMRRENPPFTKDELMKILEQVHLHNGNPPWQDVATLLNRTATAWQCLLAYQTKLTSSRSSPWTREEDEVLLKYVAAMGPQWVLTLGSAADLSAHVLPNRTPKQILARANTTLVNPNFTHGIWSVEEERKLVLCMKVYRDTPNPIMRAAAHFPNRATKSVSEKWERSLNPEYSTNPFTASEDRDLMEAVRLSPDAGWTEISRRFPSRHARTLANRWNELASPEDLLRKYGSVMKQEGARRGVVGSEGLLSSDDFVVRAKRKLNDD